MACSPDQIHRHSEPEIKLEKPGLPSLPPIHSLNLPTLSWLDGNYTSSDADMRHRHDENDYQHAGRNYTVVEGGPAAHYIPVYGHHQSYSESISSLIKTLPPECHATTCRAFSLCSCQQHSSENQVYAFSCQVQHPINRHVGPTGGIDKSLRRSHSTNGAVRPHESHAAHSACASMRPGPPAGAICMPQSRCNEHTSADYYRHNHNPTGKHFYYPNSHYSHDMQPSVVYIPVSAGLTPGSMNESMLSRKPLHRSASMDASGYASAGDMMSNMAPPLLFSSAQPTTCAEKHDPKGKVTEVPRRRPVLPKHASNILNSWLCNRLENPYPTDHEKTALVLKTGLTMTQINNWFINARRRLVPSILAAGGSNHNAACEKNGLPSPDSTGHDIGGKPCLKDTATDPGCFNDVKKTPIRFPQQTKPNFLVTLLVDYL